MREILFRGKRKGNGEWVEGDLQQDKDLGQFYIYGYDYYTDGGGLEREEFCYEVLPDTVGQYTGLTDKNGKKIFEGDILKAGEFIGTVEYNKVIASFVAKIYDSTKKYYHWSPLNEGDVSRQPILAYTEVIGNIYDNPELLEEGAE